MALAILCAGAAGAEDVASEGSRARRVCLSACSAIAAAAGLYVFAEFDGFRERDELRTEVAALATHPRLLTIGGDAELGRVFARQIGGVWVASSPIPWVTCFAAVLTPRPEDDARFSEVIRTEQSRYARDIVQGRPDVILIDGDGWHAWTQQSSELRRALSSYRPVGRVGETTVWSLAAVARS